MTLLRENGQSRHRQQNDHERPAKQAGDAQGKTQGKTQGKKSRTDFCGSNSATRRIDMTGY
jgi:hypothetical protein